MSIIKIIENASELVGVSAKIMIAICTTESNLKPNVINYHDGDGHSYGLCQVKINTARRFKPNITDTELLNAYYNAQIAAKEFKRQLDRYDGNTLFAIAAYNSGTLRFNSKGEIANRKYVAKVLSQIPQLEKE